MLSIDLTGKRALVAGVADDGGFGFAIAKALAEAGASVCVGTWPPALGIFEKLLERGKLDHSRKMSDGSLLTFERVYPIDAAYDTLADAPAAVRESKRYASRGDFSIAGAGDRLHDVAIETHRANVASSERGRSQRLLRKEGWRKHAGLLGRICAESG